MNGDRACGPAATRQGCGALRDQPSTGPQDRPQGSDRPPGPGRVASRRGRTADFGSLVRRARSSPRPWMVQLVLVAVLFTAPDSVVTPALALGLGTVGATVLTGRAGLPTLGQAAPFAVGAYTAALLGRAGVTAGPVQLAAAALAAAAFAGVCGTAVVRARGVTALMITLAIGELTATAAGRWKAVTGGTDGLAGMPPVRPFWGAGPLTDDTSVFWYVLTVTALATVATAAVLRSPAGLLLAGTRDHETRMRASGHPVTRYLLVTHLGAGVLAGLGGALLVTAQSYVSPADVGFGTSSLMLLAAVLGGAGSPVGALAGTVLVVLTRDQLAAQWPGHGPLVLGVLFTAAVYLLPRGLSLPLPRPRNPEATS